MVSERGLLEELQARTSVWGFRFNTVGEYDRFLEETVWLYRNHAFLDEKGRLFVFGVDREGDVKLEEFWRDRIYPLLRRDRRLVPLVARVLQIHGLPMDYDRALVFLRKLARVLEALVESGVDPRHVTMALNEYVVARTPYTRASLIGEFDSSAKREIVEGDKRVALVPIFALALIGLPKLDVDKFLEMLREGLYSFALMRAHAAATAVTLRNLILKTPEEIREYLRATGLEGSDERLAILLERFGIPFLEAMRELNEAGVVVGGDTLETSVYPLGPAKIGARIGIGEGHEVRLALERNKVIVEYHDHSAKRLAALAHFIRRTGLGRIVEQTEHDLIVETDVDRLPELARTLATLVSVDLLGLYDIYYSAKDVNDLFRLRVELGKKMLVA